jgi:predicted transcriptional regulator
MADDAMKVELDSALAGKVRVFAAAAGTDVEGVVRRAVSNYVDDWSITLDRLAQYDRDGESLDAETVLAEFKSAVAARSDGLA